MLKFLRSKRVLLIAALATILGWAGINVSEKDIGNVVNLALQEGEQTPNDIETQKRDELQQQSQQEEQQNTSPTNNNAGGISGEFNKASRISPQRREHILHGDATGGGHMHGANKPCKSEFPEHWNEDTIIKEVELIAANDNLAWQQQRNGYYVTEQKVGTVKVRVVKGRNGKDVITAYPTNVKRNPCPRHANDN